MTKEEVYEYLNFQGIYDVNVKRRLKRLIKKYHPDLNNGDDTTIKIINEVKKELETGDFKFEDKEIENQNNNYSFSSASYKLSTINLINRLKKEVEQLNIRIESDYKDEFTLLKSYNEIDKIYKQLLLRIKIANKQITKLNKVNYVDKIIIALIVIISIILFLNFNLVIVIIMIIMFIIEIYYIMIRIKQKKSLHSEIINIKKLSVDYEAEFENINNEIEKIKLEMFKKKQSSIRKREDIRFYERIINGESSSECENSHVK